MKTSLKLYEDCQEYFEQALASPRGIAIDLETQGMATRLRQKLNTFRKKTRDRNLTIYPPEHPMHGLSPYDHFAVVTPEDTPTRVLIHPQRIEVKKVTPL